MMMYGLWDITHDLCNYNGSLRTDARYFEDNDKNTDVVMYIETHQCISSKLPNV